MHLVQRSIRDLTVARPCCLNESDTYVVVFATFQDLYHFAAHDKKKTAGPNGTVLSDHSLQACQAAGEVTLQWLFGGLLVFLEASRNL